MSVVASEAELSHVGDEWFTEPTYTVRLFKKQWRKMVEKRSVPDGELEISTRKAWQWVDIPLSEFKKLLDAVVV